MDNLLNSPETATRVASIALGLQIYSRDGPTSYFSVMLAPGDCGDDNDWATVVVGLQQTASKILMARRRNCQVPMKTLISGKAYFQGCRRIEAGRRLDALGEWP
jgi:hypothetical protein